MGDNEDRSGCYLSLRAPLETWPMAPSVLVSLTSACDIITHGPDINPNTVCSDKKSNAERPFLTGSHPANTGIVRHDALQLLWACLRRYEIFMKTSYAVVCFQFGFNIFAFTESWSRGLERSGRGKAAKAERKEERGDDGGSKRVGLEGLKRDGEGVWECERKGCEIVKRRERKLEGEIERGMNC